MKESNKEEKIYIRPALKMLENAVPRKMLILYVNSYLILICFTPYNACINIALQFIHRLHIKKDERYCSLSTSSNKS